jgi:hypothetical protein
MDPTALERFFRELPARIDHVMVAAGRPTYGRLLEMDLARVRQVFEEHIGLALQVARHAAPKMSPGIMTNTALTGATYDIDGGEQIVAA